MKWFSIFVAMLVAAAVTIIIFARMSPERIVGFGTIEETGILGAAADNIPDTARIEITGADDVVVLARSDDGWVLESHDGYPARGVDVDAMLAALGNLRASIAARTSDERLWQDHRVNSPGRTGAGTRIVLQDSADNTIAEVVLGHTLTAPGQGEMTKVAVRTLADDRVWLADGELSVPDKVPAWTDPTILSLPAERIRLLEINPPAGNTITVDNAPDTPPSVKGLANDSNAEWIAGRLLGAFANLTFEDIHGEDVLEEADAAPWRITLRDDTGVVHEIRLWEQNDRGLLKITQAGAEQNRRHRGVVYEISPFLLVTLRVEPESQSQ